MEKFSASAASRHMNCRGSANLEVAIPNWVPPAEDPTANTAANRGSLMHELFAGAMHLPPKDALMMAKAIEYVSNVRALRRFKALVEETVEAAWLVSRPKTTADLVLYVQDEIHVLDLKTGMIPVEVVHNPQLMYYGITYGPLAPKAKGVTLHVVQPWADRMESWFASTAELRVFMDEAIKTEADLLAGDVSLLPGDHCQFCPANPHSRAAKGRPFCPAMMGLLYPEPFEEDVLLQLGEP